MAEASEIHVLGELSVRCGGETRALPRSRKVRALLAYLAVTGREHRREQLCDLFWDVADDRRAALRWSLSKLRKVLEPPAHSRLLATRTHVKIELSAGGLDIEALRAAGRVGFATQSTDALEALAHTFRGELLEGMLLPEFDAFEAWLEAERAEARALHSKLRRTLVERLASEPARALPHARAWASRSGEPEAQRWVTRLSGELSTSAESPASAVPAANTQTSTQANTQPNTETNASLKPALGAGAVPRTPARPLIGRDREVARMCLIADEARTQRIGRIVLVIGEPGMGKTRLLEELRQRQHERAPSVLEGTFHEAERNRPLAPFLDALRDVLRAAAPPETEATAPDREQLFETLAGLIRRGADAQGLGLLLLDDAHLCDPSSSELLHYVVRTAARSPLLTVIACRPAELDDNVELSRALGALRRRQLVEEIVLQPLDERALRVLLTASQDEASVERSIRESAGNPLLALEMAQASSVRRDVPRTLADLVLARVAGLPRGTRDLLRWAAVFERGPVVALEAACSDEVPEFVTALETATRYGLLRFEPGSPGNGSFSLSHALIHRILYDAISPLRRAAMHRTVVEVLGQGHQDADRSSLMAYHATRADRPDLAARALIEGATRCATLGAVTEAGELADRALALVAQLDPSTAPALELKALLVLSQVRRSDDPARFVTRLTELGLCVLDQGCGDDARRAFHAASNLRWEAGASHEGYGLARQAWQASRAGDAAERVRASSFMALCLVLMEKQLPDAHAIVHEAEALARTEKASAEPVELALARGLLHLHAGRFEDARRDASDARMLARVGHNAMLEATALQMSLQLEHAVGRAAAVSEAACALRALSARIREGGEGAMAGAGLALAQESLSAARPGLTAALAELCGLDDKRRVAWVANRFARREREQGDPRAAQRLAEQALHAARAVEALSEAAIACGELMAAATWCADDAAYVAAEETLAELESSGTLSFSARKLIDQLTTPPAAEGADVKGAPDPSQATPATHGDM